MKSSVISCIFITILFVYYSVGAQDGVIRPVGGSSTIDSANFARKSDLLPNATNGGQFTYIDTVGVDSMKSRAMYSAPPWSIDSANIKTSFNRFWFRQTADSLAVDTVFCVLRGTATDTVTVRVLWGTSLGIPVDSLADLKCYSTTTGTKAASIKVISPYNLVWVKLVEADGTATEACIMLDGRRTWPQ